MDPSIHIRMATAGDIPDILHITQEAFKIYAQNLGLPGVVQALNETEQSIQADLAKKKIFIGFIDGQPAGCVRADVAGQVGYISRFGTLPEAPKCGLGLALLAAAEAWMRDQGAVLSALHTSCRMNKLIIFYYQAGYFVHSTTTHKGYVRGLLLHELAERGVDADLSPVMQR